MSLTRGAVFYKTATIDLIMFKELCFSGLGLVSSSPHYQDFTDAMCLLNIL